MDFNAFHYVPIISVRPSEMQALEELPPYAKTGILPFVVLQPWTTAKEFPSTLAKVSASTAGKPIIVDITDEVFDGARRPVHDVFDELRDPNNGYAAWRDFVEENEAFTPVVQLSDPRSIAPQIHAFKAVGRGVVVRLHEQIFGLAENIAQLFKSYPYNNDVYFILDFQRQDKNILTKTLIAVNTCKSIRKQLPDCFISVSASTFPISFADLLEQEIFERRFYTLVADQIGYDNHIYCDRASVRAEKQNGGGGSPAPRIDNALSAKWKFFREAEEEDRDEAYQIAANRATTCPEWIDHGIWGTEMIKRTAAGEESAIYSPKMPTSARINIHMYMQAGAPEPAAEIEWTDL
ncbi:MAG: beta family protein [Notoacmeibacter sp.]|nr:beta family protein [Notoacmeibacter sp.]